MKKTKIINAFNERFIDIKNPNKLGISFTRQGALKL